MLVYNERIYLIYYQSDFLRLISIKAMKKFKLFGIIGAECECKMFPWMKEHLALETGTRAIILFQ